MAELREALTARRDAAAETVALAAPSADRGLMARGLLYLLGLIAAVVVDLGADLPWLVSPAVLGGVALAVALEIGRLRTLGTDWRVVLGRAPPTPPRPSAPTPAATARFAAWAPVVSRVLADRVVVRGMVARLPAAERRGIQDLLPLLDRLTAEAVAAAEQLADLEQWSGHGADREEVARRRREHSTHLDDAVRAVARLRRAVRGADAEGIGRIRDDVGRMTGSLLRAHAAPAHDQQREAEEAQNRSG
jgi:hypothetical protein